MKLSIRFDEQTESGNGGCHKNSAENPAERRVPSAFSETAGECRRIAMLNPERYSGNLVRSE